MLQKNRVFICIFVFKKLFEQSFLAACHFYIVMVIMLTGCVRIITRRVRVTSYSFGQSISYKKKYFPFNSVVCLFLEWLGLKKGEGSYQKRRRK